MTVSLIIEFEAVDGAREDVIEWLMRALEETRAFDGCETVTFGESVDSPGSFVMAERWEAIENYDAYKAWRQETGSSIFTSGLVNVPPRVSVFDVISG